MQNILKIIILVSITLGSVQIFCQDAPTEPTIEKPVVVEEPAAETESSTEDSIDKPSDKSSEKPTVVTKRTPVKRPTGLQLLDIHDAELIDARIPGIEITERKQIIADIDEPELQTKTEPATMSENSEQVSSQADDSDNSSEKKTSGIEKSYHSWNKVAKRWVPRGFIILLLILLIMLYKSKTRKRRRVFRKIPSKRR